NKLPPRKRAVATKSTPGACIPVPQADGSQLVVDLELPAQPGDTVIAALSNRGLASWAKLPIGRLERIGPRVAWVVYQYPKYESLKRIDLGKYRVLVVTGRYMRLDRKE